MQKRCDRNRKRSKRRAIYCPEHACHLDSVSQKYSLYTESAQQLRERGISRQRALLLVATQKAVPLAGEWLEAFWCPECQKTEWFHVRQLENRQYAISPAPSYLWEQASGVIHPYGNPTVGEFTHRQARMTFSHSIKDFRAMG